MLVRGAVGGCAVGEVDWVCGRDGDGAGVEVYGGVVVFALHGGVALFLEGFAFGGRCCCATSGRGVGGGRSARGRLRFEVVVEGVDLEEVLLACGLCHLRFAGWVDVEGVGEAGGGYFYGLAVFGLECAIFQGVLEEVDYGEGELLLWVECGRLLPRC